MEITLWTCIALVAYVYLGYPTLIWAIARWSPRSVAIEEAFEPDVTLVISAYNEQRVIREKIANALSLDYPSNKLEVIVVSDSSSDATDNIVQQFEHAGVRLVRMGHRVGKSLGLNAALEVARGEIVALTDANSIFERTAIRALVRPFSNPRVGCVTGAQHYIDEEASVGRDEGLYWRYELCIKALESRIGSLVGSDGAIMAIRKELYVPLAASDLSDFIIPLRVVASGYANVFQPQARCYEKTAPSYNAEFGRKVRIVNRAWRSTLKMRRLLNPLRHGLFAVQLVSHKILRWWIGLAFVAMLAASASLAVESPFYRGLLIAQVLFYLAAATGFLLSRRGVHMHSALSASFYFCMVNIASLKGILDGMLGRTYTTWSTNRER